MIVAENPRPDFSDFRDLMAIVDSRLNQEARLYPDFFVNKNGTLIEPDVCDIVAECAKGTKFEGSIELVSGHHFPDIVAAKFYGIEVKTTKEDHWTSTGSSILESSRVKDVERIYLTFAKLFKPVEFKSRPYEECLSGIAVTHYPRYLIDMNLAPGNTIFDKMGVPYEVLREMENPAAPVANYYKSKLGPGESLWWAGDNADAVAPPTMRLWTNVPSYEKILYEAQGFVFFPETILSRDLYKYGRMVFWLVKNYGIVNSNVRDSFSSGGRELMKTEDGRIVNMPAVFRKLREHIIEFKSTLYSTPADILSEYWGESIDVSRADQWIKLVLKNYPAFKADKEIAKSVFVRLFNDYNVYDRY